MPLVSSTVLSVSKGLERSDNGTSVTAVGGTTNVPETAIFFSGGGFSNFVSAV